MRKYHQAMQDNLTGNNETITTAFILIAFYMFRLYYGIFWGTENKEAHLRNPPFY